MSAVEKTLDRNIRCHHYTVECISMYNDLVGLSSGDAPCLAAAAFWRTMMCNTTDSFVTPGPEYGSYSVYREFLRLVDEDNLWMKIQALDLRDLAQNRS